MRNRNRWIALSLAVLLCAAALSGCTPQAVTPTDATPTQIASSEESLPLLPTETDVSSAPDASTAESSEESSADSSLDSAPESVVSTASSGAQTPSSTVTSAASSEVSSVPESSAAPSSAPAVSSAVSPVKSTIVNYTVRPTYASVQSEIAALQQAFPDLISVGSIGSSAQGRDLTLMKVGKGTRRACLVAGIHAREYITVSYLLRVIEEYCRAYESESGFYGVYDMNNLFSAYTLYCVPLANPDGLEIIGGRAQPSQTISYFKNAKFDDFKNNANGVNLNRNFPFCWDQIDNGVTVADATHYKGPSAGSEPETQALMALCEANDFHWMTSVHVRGNCLYWSDEVNRSVGKSKVIADQLKKRCDLYLCPTSDDVNGYGGGFENWFREQYGRPGFCLELMPNTVLVNPLSDYNNRHFDAVLCWEFTRRAPAVIMAYGHLD